LTIPTGYDIIKYYKKVVIILHIKFYGTRGSIPFFSRDNISYGGNSTCVKIETGGRTVILDCGSGIVQFLCEYLESIKIGGSKKPLCLDILISHLHLDHIIGLSMFSPLMSGEHSVRIYTKSRDERLSLAEQVFGAFRPPYWPVELAKLSRAAITEIKDGEAFALGPCVKVTPFASNHPDGTSAFRIDSINSVDSENPGGPQKSVVYMMDHSTERDPVKYEEEIRRCENADVVIYDSAYLPADYETRKTWGHSVYSDGIALAEKSRCKHMIFGHFDQKYTDAELDELAREIDRININGSYKKYFIAYDGMELNI
jgi:ribonuclease BN (tRNA processing enzyme)